MNPKKKWAVLLLTFEMYANMFVVYTAYVHGIGIYSLLQPVGDEV